MIRRFFIATTIAFLVTSLGHYYLYVRIVEPLFGNHPAGITIFATLWALTFFGFALARAVPAILRRVVELFMFLWMGTAYLFALVCLLTAPLNLWFSYAGYEEAGRNLAAAVMVAGTALTAFGLFQTQKRETIVEQTIPLTKPLPTGIGNLKIVLISDIHVAGLVGKRRMRRLAASVNALNPDIIIVAGDLVDGSVRQLRNEVMPLGEMKAPHGIFYVTGNHEYYCGAEKWKRFLEKEFGWKILSNSNMTLEAHGVSMNMLGIEDRSWMSANRIAPVDDMRLEIAAGEVQPETQQTHFNILVAHQPKDTRSLVKFPWIDLQVSGHTHGGQFWPLHIFVHKDQKWNRGLYTIPETGQKIFVCQGTGFWGPPMRLGTRCEICVLKFKAPSSTQT